MTVLVGVKCKNGVVIGADGIATSAAGKLSTIEIPTTKIDIIDGKIIVAGTGSVGLGQRFTHIVNNSWQNKLFKGNAIDIATQLSRNGLINFEQTGLRPPNIQFGALVAFPCSKVPTLCEFDIGTFQPELKVDDRIWLVSMGSGQQIADPFLFFLRSIFWRDELPTLQQAVFGVTWSLAHTVECNPGGIGEPIQIAVLSNDNGEPSARILSQDELEEHRQNVDGAKAHLREYPSEILDSKVDVPELPTPPQ